MEKREFGDGEYSQSLKLREKNKDKKIDNNCHIEDKIYLLPHTYSITHSLTDHSLAPSLTHIYTLKTSSTQVIKSLLCKSKLLSPHAVNTHRNYSLKAQFLIPLKLYFFCLCAFQLNYLSTCTLNHAVPRVY